MRTGLLCLALIATGCGGVATIDVHDERVPLEARQWVGGADDAVAIARAGYDDARTELAELARWKDEVAAKKPRGADAGSLAGPLSAFVDARWRLAVLSVDRAAAELELARAARNLAHAETAMRYDLAVYELAPLRAEVERSRSELERAGRAVEEAIVVREKASADFWSAYRSAYARSPEIGQLFWLSE